LEGEIAASVAPATSLAPGGPATLSIVVSDFCGARAWTKSGYGGSTVIGCAYFALFCFGRLMICYSRRYSTLSCYLSKS
jgi:hypothetical protein